MPATTKLCPDEVTDVGVMVAPGFGLWKNTLYGAVPPLITKA